jgi:hypothetical protein
MLHGNCAGNPARNRDGAARMSGLARFAACTLLAVPMLLAGCASDAQNGALIGGLLGAGTGAIIGHQSGEGWAGAGIGAAAGALGGYIVGNEVDKDHGHHSSWNDSRRNYRYDY